MKTSICLVGVAGMLTLTAAETAVRPVIADLPPEAALAAFDHEPGLRVELVAAEPQVVAPCALAWDEQGRLFVAENRGYPLGGPGGQPLGVVVRLDDTDGDGLPDRRVVFAEGLTFPNGLLPWRGGWIVTCAPDVLFLKDTDGDGKADRRDVLLTGFSTDQSTQLRVNRPILGLDGWVYLASGLSGGRVTSPLQPGAKPHELRGDLRFRPDTGEYEGIDGKSQFGQSFDDFGRRFGVHNRVQCQHYVLPSRYVARHPQLPSPGVLQNTPDLVENPWMRAGGGAARVFPISANLTTADSHAGTYSAACAVHVWRGGALPERFRNAVFSADPTANLVRYDLLVPNGATFHAQRVGERTEFLRSPDNWFRPVYLATGPDGALYVADMYRKTIEHPDYLPEEVRKRTDFVSGSDRGRVWRIHAEDRVGSKPALAWVKGDTAVRVAALKASNSWDRDTAFQLLWEAGAATAAPALRQILAEGESVAPATRVAALHLLALADQLEDANLLQALDSAAAGVREVALRLAEPRLARSEALRTATLRAATDPDARVRFQAALAVGELRRAVNTAGETAVIDSLVQVLARDGADKWARAAVLSSSFGASKALLLTLMNWTGTRESSPVVFRETARLAAAEGAAQPADPELLERDFYCRSKRLSLEAQAAILTGLAEGLAAAKPGFVLGRKPTVPNSGCDVVAGVARLARDVTQRLNAPETPLTARMAAAEFLRWVEPTLGAPALRQLVTNAVVPLELRTTAVRALATIGIPGLAKEYLAEDLWRSYPPLLRDTLLSALLARPDYHPGILSMLECEAVPIGAIPAAQREQWLHSKDESVRTRATKLFQSGGDRRTAYEAAKACLKLTPAPSNGRQIFARLCAGCHRLEQEGFAVGPDLFGIRNQPKEAILLHLIQPDLEVAPNFTAYAGETKDGRVIAGLLIGETATAVTLRQAQGIEETLPREQLVNFGASRHSLMPEELEKGMSLQELADLLGYLRGER